MEQLAKNRPVRRAGNDRLHEGLLQPAIDKVCSLIDGKRIGEYAWPGGQPQKCQQANPWQSDALSTGERLLEPPSCGFVVKGIPVDGVDQQVGVNEDPF